MERGALSAVSPLHRNGEGSGVGLPLFLCKIARPAPMKLQGDAWSNRAWAIEPHLCHSGKATRAEKEPPDEPAASQAPPPRKSGVRCRPLATDRDSDDRQPLPDVPDAPLHRACEARRRA